MKKQSIFLLSLLTAGTLYGAEINETILSTVNCPRMSTIPVIDGKVNVSEWYDAASYGNMVVQSPEPGGMLSDYPFRFWIGHTNTHLYIAFRVYRKTSPRSSTPGQGKNCGTAVWGDDAVEIMIDAGNQRKKGFNIAMNAKSDYSDFRIYPTLKDKWNSTWNYRASLRPDGWEGEIAIPFTQLETTTPKYGDLWRFDIIVNRKTPTPMVSRFSHYPEFGAKWTDMSRRAYLTFSDQVTVNGFQQDNKEAVQIINTGDKKQTVRWNLSLWKYTGKDAFQPRLLKFRGSSPEFSLLEQQAGCDQLAAYGKQDVKSQKNLLPGKYVEIMEISDAAGKRLFRQVSPLHIQPPFRVKITNAFLKNKQAVVSTDCTQLFPTVKKGRIEVELLAKNKVILKKNCTVQKPLHHFILPLNAFHAKDSFTIRTRLTAKANTAENVRHFVIPPSPLWEKEVPKFTPRLLYPWQPMKYGKDYVQVTERRYQYKSTLLPVQIQAAGKNLFHAAPEWKVVFTDNTSADLMSGNFQTNGNEVAVCRQGIKKSSGFNSVFESLTEFDGFQWNDLNLDSAKKIRELSLTFRFPAERAVFYNHTYKGTAPFKTTDYGDWGRIPANGIDLPFCYGIWIGDHERGLSLCFESDQFWTNASQNGTIRIRRNQKETVVTIRMLHNDSRSGKLHFGIGLQATPVRPLITRDWTDTIFTLGKIYEKNNLKGLNGWKKQNLGRLCSNGGKFGILWCVGGDEFGHCFPNPTVLQNLRHITNTGNKIGEKYIYYCGWSLNGKMKECEPWLEEMLRSPQAKWGGANLYKQCPAGPWAEMYLAGVKRLTEKYGAYGVYMDQTTELSSCTNLAHGCGYIGDDGSIHPTFPIRKMRHFYKRLYTLLQQQCGKNDFMLYSHNSTQPLFPPVDSFISRRCYLEIFSKMPDKSKVHSLDRIAAAYNPIAMGIPAEATWWNGFHATIADNELMSTLWLLGCGLKGVQWKMDSRFKEGYGVQEHAEIGVMRCLQKLSGSQVHFIPFWQKKPYQCKTENSCWITSDQKKMLAVFSNLNAGMLQTNVKLPASFTVTDAVTGQVIGTNTTGFRLAIAPHNYRALFMEKK